VIRIIIICVALSLASCGEDWSCTVDGDTMYSVSETGNIGGAGKGCTCQEIRSFELRTFGEIDEGGIKSDFGC
jgi:hypothetical protein